MIFGFCLMLLLRTSAQERKVSDHFDGKKFYNPTAEAFDQPQADLREALKKESIAPDNFITLHEGETKIYGVNRGKEK